MINYKFKLTHRHLVHCKLIPYDDYLRGRKEKQIIEISENKNELMYGEILKQPNTKDKKFNQALPEGTHIVAKGYDPHTNELFIYPLQSQKILDAGEYLVSMQGILVYYEIPVEDDTGRSKTLGLDLSIIHRALAYLKQRGRQILYARHISR